jgi:hypothetical protein
MANNFTPQQTHNYDQNMAHYEKQVDNLLESWAECAAESCCPEHAVMNYADYVMTALQGAEVVDIVMVITCLARRLAEGSHGA